jgi:hypothetical protein
MAERLKLRRTDEGRYGIRPFNDLAIEFQHEPASWDSRQGDESQ